tara:strand:+ start:668 stop:847 length:180 start_codon:yes stop_codon:yes gene_type:complete
MPKNWNKWTLSEQELWLVGRLQEYYVIENQITKMLAKIRGGERIQVKEIDRPDEAMLKS